MSQDTVPILLYGHLRARFGKRFDLAVKSPQEALRALISMLPGFREHLEKHSTPGYRIRVGKECLGEKDLALPSGGQAIRIVPVVAGAKDGWGQILAGIAIIAITYFSAGTLTPALVSALYGIGTSMIIGGIAQVLAGNPAYSQGSLDKGPADTPNYTFSGPHMTTGQGNPVPLGYGRMRVSGALVSLGISSETWRTGGFKDGGLEDGTRSGNGDTTPWVWSVAPA